VIRAGAYLRRADRLRSPRDFRRVNERGVRAASANFVVLAAPPREPSPAGGSRLGITVTRRVGCAVVRNRVKRRVRECFRRQRGELRDPADVVVIARRGAAGLEAAQVESELTALFRSCAR
jgi:ribonuclease P protein component